MKTLTFEIGDELRLSFRAWCISNKTTVKKVLNEKIRECLEGKEVGRASQAKAKIEYVDIPGGQHLKLTKQDLESLQDLHGKKWGKDAFLEELVRISNHIPNAKNKINNHLAYVNSWFDRKEQNLKQEGQGRKLTNAEITTNVVKNILERSKENEI